jgi:hypothetical protein
MGCVVEYEVSEIAVVPGPTVSLCEAASLVVEVFPRPKP